MSKLTLYNGIVVDLLTVRYNDSDNVEQSIKTVRLWRNDLERESVEKPFLFPAVFIEFLPSAFMESASKGYQTVDMTVRLHICFESYKDEDTDILALTQAVYSKLQLKSYGTWGAMKRRNEEQNFDHTNVQDYIQDYLVAQGKDFYADQRPSTDAQVDTITVTPEIGITT